MSTNSFQEICRNCSNTHKVEFVSRVNTHQSPELKEEVMSGRYFSWECPHCGCRNIINKPFLYHDPEQKLMMLLTDLPLRSEDLPEGYQGRLVKSVGDLMEKIKIFEAGLDDVVMEICKYITLQELQKDVVLKFYSIDGADSELTFTYPEGGDMQMIAVGFNVYEDCAGIVQRNPAIKESARGLASIDPDWISKFFA